MDISALQLFVELNELIVDKDQEMRWKERARWIKFEEDVEEETDRWGKPHVASLSFRSLLELRRTITHGKPLPAAPGDANLSLQPDSSANTRSCLFSRRRPSGPGAEHSARHRPPGGGNHDHLRSDQSGGPAQRPASAASQTQVSQPAGSSGDRLFQIF